MQRWQSIPAKTSRQFEPISEPEFSSDNACRADAAFRLDNSFHNAACERRHAGTG